MEKHDKAKNEKPKYSAIQNSKFMINLSWKTNKITMIFAVLTALFEVGSSLLGLFVAPAILRSIEDGQSLRDFVTLVLMFIIPLMIVKMVVAYLNGVGWWGRVDTRLAVVQMLKEKVMTTSYVNVLKQDMQKKLEQSVNATNNNNSATEAIFETFSNILKNVVGFVIYIFLLAILDPLIIGIVLVTTIASFIINRHINEWGYRHRHEEAAYHKQMNYISGKTADVKLAKDIKLFGMANWLEDVYQSGFHLIKDFITRREKVYLWADIIDLIFTFLRNGLAYLFLISLVLNGDLSASSFLLYFTAIGGFTTWITGILTELTTLNKQSLELSTIREFLDYEEPFLFDSGAKLSPEANGRYELELRNVTFAYDGAKTNTLEKINLKIPAGEKLAIVGINGAGKTTLVKLLCGFLDPTEGEVLLNGVNIKTYNRRDYYSMFSAVFQDFSIIAGSIAQNVAQGVDHIDLNRVLECITKAGIAEKINGLSDGLDSNLDKSVYEDAVDLSGGQLQRLMLARALYKNAPILVLDEPTAALDPIAESEIYQAYNDLTVGRTAIYISHRLASTGFCDRTILLDGNQIAEVGTHQELMQNSGKYAEMFEIQSKYYQDEVESEVSDNG